jgi:hypothetical protein
MTLGESEIIQIDATVITGVLILLSLSLGIANPGAPSGNPSSSNLTGTFNPELKFTGTFPLVFALEIIKGILILSIVIPFADSALWAIRAHSGTNRTADNNQAVQLMRYGFIYLMIGIGAIVVMQVWISATLAAG